MLPREHPHSFTPILIQMRRGRTVVEQVHERTPSRHTHELVRISDIIRLLGLRRIQRIVFLNHFPAATVLLASVEDMPDTASRSASGDSTASKPVSS